MWFKNLSLFSLTETFTLSPEELAEKMADFSFRPCGPHELSSFGWCPPTGKKDQPLAYGSNGFIMLCGKKEERVLPASVVNELTQEKIMETEEKQGRKLSRKERTELKDQLIFELLPRAFTFSRKVYAYVDPKNGWIIIDTASSKQAEDVLSLLRQTLGSLPAYPINTIARPATVLTAWLTSQQLPAEVKIEDECELRSQDEGGGVVRCKRHDLGLPEITNHLASGKEASKLAINWADRLAFIVDEQLTIKRLRFLDMVQEQRADIQADDDLAQFDADFAVMSLEIAGFLPHFLQWFGGLQKA